MKFEIPKPMKIEHDELHADLVKATKAGAPAKRLRPWRKCYTIISSRRRNTRCRL